VWYYSAILHLSSSTAFNLYIYIYIDPTNRLCFLHCYWASTAASLNVSRAGARFGLFHFFCCTPPPVEPVPGIPGTGQTQDLCPEHFYWTWWFLYEFSKNSRNPGLSLVSSFGDRTRLARQEKRIFLVYFKFINLSYRELTPAYTVVCTCECYFVDICFIFICNNQNWMRYGLVTW
jgi:hypothetical protein